MFDVFPILPQEPVKEGDKWEVTILMALNSPTHVFPGLMLNRLQRFEDINGTTCAVIDCTLSGSLETAKHPGMLVDEIRKKVRPKYSLQGEGTAHFDPVAGIVLRQEQEVQWTKRWTGKLDPAVPPENLIRP